MKSHPNHSKNSIKSHPSHLHPSHPKNSMKSHPSHLHPSQSLEKLNEEPSEPFKKLNKEPPEPPPSESLEKLNEEPPEPPPPESPPPEPIGQPRRRQVFLGYKKNNPEYVLFSLSLSDPKLFKEAINAELCFTDPGAQFLWGLANDRYGQDSQSFDRFERVESYLANYCSNPEVLTLTMEEPYSRFDKEQRNEIFHECLHRVKNQKMNHESKRMSQKMGPTTDQEDLEHFMELQRKKRNL